MASNDSGSPWANSALSRSKLFRPPIPIRTQARTPISVNVHLRPVFDRFVADLLKGGLYQGQSEVLRKGLRLLKEREELKQLRIAELRKEIAIGGEQADRGEFVDGSETIAEIRKRSARRKRAKG